MTSLSRRGLLAAAAVTGTGLLLGNAAEALTPEAAHPGVYQVKPLPFNPAQLNGISEKLIVSHHDNNYAGAVKRLSVIQSKIAQLADDAAPFEMGSLKREALIAMNSMINHELYFDNLGGDGKIAGKAEQLIEQQFGTREAWEHDFRLTGQSLAGGSGWVILAYSPHDRQIYNIWCSDHQVNLAAGIPLLVMDMYEHAYQMDYGADAKKYIDAFFANINWEKVSERIEKLPPA